LDPGIIALLRRTVAAIDPDVVQTHSVKSHAAVRLAGIQRERPWIAFHHGYTRPDLKMRLYNQADRWSLRGADRVVTPARAFIAELVQRGVARQAIVVVPNAVDLDAARGCDGERDALRKWLGGPERVVLSIGRLSREKGHADLVRAFGLLKQRRPDLNVRLVIAGDGPERASLASLSAWAAPGSVQFLGHVRDAHRLHAIADVAVLPSHSEGSPNALLEAAAYACPIVATGVGDVADILTDQESGLIVPPRDAAALASAIEILVVDRAAARTYGESARRVVAARYQPADRARTLLNLYADLAVTRDVSSTPSPVCAF
jgi:glycosyltransferase involved in cell wall biosynthesis